MSMKDLTDQLQGADLSNFTAMEADLRDRLNKCGMGEYWKEARGQMCLAMRNGGMPSVHECYTTWIEQIDSL